VGQAEEMERGTVMVTGNGCIAGQTIALNAGWRLFKLFRAKKKKRPGST
jgi:hypothetical protein